MALMRIERNRKDKAISPAISTVIITGIMVALISVALSFASNFLVLRMAESEFSSVKQSMQTLGLQIDDVAWIVGRTETMRYSGRYGDVIVKNAVNYTVYINTTTKTNFKFYTTKTNIVCFNMPVSHYSVGNGFFELIYPSYIPGFVMYGASAPLSRVFAIEKQSMPDGSFVRLVVVPTIRMLNLTIGNTKYVRLYLPILLQGATPRNSQSITLTGQSVSKIGETVTGIRIEASFPLAGFDNFFFQFPQTEESIPMTESAILELYVAGISVELGVHA